jgi:hypothetical protein
MRILSILLAAFAIIIGLRMAFIAAITAFTGKILVRTGLRSYWQPAPTMNDAWKYAFRDGLMGILFIILGVALIV